MPNISVLNFMQWVYLYTGAYKPPLELQITQNSIGDSKWLRTFWSVYLICLPFQAHIWLKLVTAMLIPSWWNIEISQFSLRLKLTNLVKGSYPPPATLTVSYEEYLKIIPFKLFHWTYRFLQCFWYIHAKVEYRWSVDNSQMLQRIKLILTVVNLSVMVKKVWRLLF